MALDDVVQAGVSGLTSLGVSGTTKEQLEDTEEDAQRKRWAHYGERVSPDINKQNIIQLTRKDLESDWYVTAMPLSEATICAQS